MGARRAGKIVFWLAPAWVPADQPLFALTDDTLARKHGKAISWRV